MRTIEDVQDEINEITIKIESAEKEVELSQNKIDYFDKGEFFDEDKYKELLNEETLEVAGITMNVGDVLYEIDYTAFRTSMIDYVDSIEYTEFDEYNEFQEELETAEEELEELEEELEELKEELEELENEEEDE